MKKLLTAAAFAALTFTTPAQAQQITQQQVRVCQSVPAYNAGFVQAGNHVQRINVPAETKCYWQDEARRTVVSFYPTPILLPLAP